MAGYTRQDTADNIADTKTIDAADLDAEFDAVEAAFNNSTGHTHDGTAAEGAPIEVTGPNQEYLSEAAQFRPKTDDTYDLGSATFQWKDLYVDGTANIDSLVADTADIDGGTIDNATIGGTTPAAGSFTTVSATGNITVDGTVDGRDVAADGTKLDGIEAGADVTDTANVTAAGALMDSELTNIAAVKALDQGVATTDSPSFSQVYAGYGSAAAPSFAFNGDINTGLYRSASNEVSISTDGVERMRIDSSGNVGIGTSTPTSRLEIQDETDINMNTDGTGHLEIDGLGFNFAIALNSSGANLYTNSLSRDLIFGTNGIERMRIDGYGNVMFRTTNNAPSTNNVEGHAIGATAEFSRSGSNPVDINRVVDGSLIIFRGQGNSEGSISVSGSTVSYNGGHLARWSQLADGSKDTSLLKGTVLTNLDQMAVWSHDAVAATYYEEGDELPEGVSVGDEKTPAVDAYTEDNEQLNCMAVSSVEGDPNVAGVFVNWDEDDDQFNDMNIAMTGDMIIRIAQGTTVQRGDLLMSAGDGTAKPQGDDIVRSKTIAKVISTHVTCTYGDGSYCVPCVLMAC